MLELRHAAEHGQLDGELVERFIALLEREGPAFGEDADFETELEFERRVQDLAQPRSPDPAPASPRTSSRQFDRRNWRSGVSSIKHRVLKN